MQLKIGTIGKAHGLHGEVSVIVTTDVPQERFVPGHKIATQPADRGPLTVTRQRAHQDRWYVTFEEIPDRTVAESYRGVELVIEVDHSDEDDAWYPHELEGLEVRRLSGARVGRVAGLEPLPAQDALIIDEDGGERVYLPFLKIFVPTVDVAGGYVVIDPPGGLLTEDRDQLVVVRDDDGEQFSS